MSKQFFDKKYWSEEFKKTTWYLKLYPLYQSVVDDLKDKDKTDFYSFIEQKLINGEINLGKEIGNWDSERKPVNTVIIHHTSNKPGMTPTYLSAIQLIRLYASQYALSSFEKPISSGHVRNGEQCFYSYHWIIRTNGKYERLLEDHEIGWHAGNWKINCKSIAIVFDNDYENGFPSGPELSAAREIIAKYQVKRLIKILGHREVNLQTVCPSNLFLGENGWKKKLFL